MQYRKLYGETVVGFFQNGYLDEHGKLHETRLDREGCLIATEKIKAGRAGFGTEGAFERRLAIYERAARFMGWLE